MISIMATLTSSRAAHSGRQVVDQPSARRLNFAARYENS